MINNEDRDELLRRAALAKVDSEWPVQQPPPSRTPEVVYIENPCDHWCDLPTNAEERIRRLEARTSELLARVADLESDCPRP